MSSFTHAGGDLQASFLNSGSSKHPHFDGAGGVNVIAAAQGKSWGTLNNTYPNGYSSPLFYRASGSMPAHTHRQTHTNDSLTQISSLHSSARVNVALIGGGGGGGGGAASGPSIPATSSTGGRGTDGGNVCLTATSPFAQYYGDYIVAGGGFGGGGGSRVNGTRTAGLAGDRGWAKAVGNAIIPHSTAGIGAYAGGEVGGVGGVSSAAGSGQHRVAATLLTATTHGLDVSVLHRNGGPGGGSWGGGGGGGGEAGGGHGGAYSTAAANAAGGGGGGDDGVVTGGGGGGGSGGPYHTTGTFAGAGGGGGGGGSYAYVMCVPNHYYVIAYTGSNGGTAGPKSASASTGYAGGPGGPGGVAKIAFYY
jgi:hypothetical protein